MNSEANYKQVNEIVNSQTQIKVVKLITLPNTGSLKFTGFEKCGRGVRWQAEQLVVDSSFCPAPGLLNPESGQKSR